MTGKENDEVRWGNSLKSLVEYKRQKGFGHIVTEHLLWVIEEESMLRGHDEKKSDWVEGEGEREKEQEWESMSADSVMDPATMLNWSVLTLPELNTLPCLSSFT